MSSLSFKGHIRSLYSIWINFQFPCTIFFLSPFNTLLSLSLSYSTFFISYFSFHNINISYIPLTQEIPIHRVLYRTREDTAGKKISPNRNFILFFRLHPIKHLYCKYLLIGHETTYHQIPIPNTFQKKKKSQTFAHPAPLNKSLRQSKMVQC